MGSIIVDVSKGHQSMGRQDSVLRGKGKETLNVYVDQSQPLDKDCLLLSDPKRRRVDDNQDSNLSIIGLQNINAPLTISSDPLESFKAGSGFQTRQDI